MPTTATDVQIPAGLPVLPGVVLSAGYVLSGSEPLNKGDTLDALALPGRRVALIVADVVGNGFGAAVAVSQIKAVLRERLCAGESLRSALICADRYAFAHQELCGTTVCVALLGLDDGELEWATAGHPAPIRVAPGGQPGLLPGRPSRPLGTGGRVTTQHARLEAGGMIGLYTNGLVYSEGQLLPIGYDRLCAAFADATRAQVSTSALLAGDQVCEQVLRNAVPEGSSDDAALLVAVRSPAPEPFDLRMAAVPENLPVIRHRINAWLDDLGAGLMDHVGLGHAVVELAANVVAHAYVSANAEPVVRIGAVLAGDGVVRITVSDRGRWRPQTSGGRGLMMAAGLADGIEVNRTTRGTEITLTQRLTRSVPLLQQVGDQSDDSFEESPEFYAETRLGRLVARGPIDDLSVDLFDAALTRATRGGTADAVVNLSGVTHLASPGVQTLFDFLGRSLRTGTTLSLRAPAGSTAGQILRLVDLPTFG